ncbi:MAG: hypothetical protein JWM02_3682 [Frankiales bacterium]|nr:hypothetical protein [Frankiales bacterium]
MIGWGTPEQVAALCGISPNTVRTWAKRGVIPVACCVLTQRLLVRWVDADHRAEPIRVRRHPERAA